MASALLMLALLLPACGGDDASSDAPTATATGLAGQTLVVSNEPTTAAQPPAGGDQPAATEESTEPTPTEVRMPVRRYPPNELGQIPILEYHHIGPEPKQFTRTPAQLRADLEWLYTHGFYVVNLHDILADEIDVPEGKRPVVLTFDDGPASQFSLMEVATGQLAIDPNCAVGILELFFAEHPDFGRGGHFSVLPDRLFDWAPVADRSDQTPYVQLKMKWLVANGYEIGNHTLDHANLSKLDREQVGYQLAAANDMIHEILPDVPIEVITLPYGAYPKGSDASLLRGFQYQDRRYEWSAALLVGANPTVAPLSTQYEPFAMARIQAFDAELDKWFTIFEEQPGILYVSDGDPDTVTVPEDLHPWLVGTLDRSKLNGRELVRY